MFKQVVVITVSTTVLAGCITTDAQQMSVVYKQGSLKAERLRVLDECEFLIGESNFSRDGSPDDRGLFEPGVSPLHYHRQHDYLQSDWRDKYSGVSPKL